MKQTWSPEPSLGELFGDLARETKQLVKQEVELAKLELKENATRAGKGAAFIAGGAVLGLGADLALMTAIIALLATFMPVWVAALAVAIVMGIGGFVLIKKGLNVLKQSELAPRETIESVRKDVVWLKKHA